MSETCRYGRDSKIFYYDSEGKELKYECPHDAYVDDFCIFHHENYWKQNKESEEKVREAVLDELRNIKTGEELLCIGYHLPVIDVGKELKTLLGDVDFIRAVFQSINFNGVTFHGNVRFDVATFVGKAGFEGAIFKGRAAFGSTTFEKEAAFGSTTFEEEAAFYGATFKSGAEFSRATFKSGAEFSRATFKRWAKFYRANFQGGAEFYFAIFQGEAEFSDATFQGRAKFYDATFRGETDFVDTTFQGEVDFHFVEFESRVNFESTRFENVAYFIDTEFKERVLFYEITPELLYFRRVSFSKPERIVFERCDLRYVSFINTNITRVRFRSCSWATRYEKIKIGLGGKKAYVVFDELLLETRKAQGYPLEYTEAHETIPLEQYFDIGIDVDIDIIHDVMRDVTLDNVLIVYLMLRENFEYYVDYDTAGKFFVGEMETRRRTSSSRPDKFILCLYKTLALYGQSYIRPLLFLIGLIMGFSLLRIGLNLFLQDMLSGNIVADSIWKSVAVSSQFRGIEWVDILQWILSIPLLVLFGLALRRRFERRFRH